MEGGELAVMRVAQIKSTRGESVANMGESQLVVMRDAQIARIDMASVRSTGASVLLSNAVMTHAPTKPRRAANAVDMEVSQNAAMKDAPTYH